MSKRTPVLPRCDEELPATRWQRLTWRMWVLRLLPGAGPWVLSGFGLFWVLGVVTPSLMPLLTGALTAAIADGTTAGWSAATRDRAVTMMVLMVAVMIGQELTGTISGLLQATVQRRVDAHAQARLMRAILGPSSIHHLEDPKSIDDAEIASTAMGAVAVAVPALAGRYVAAGLACLIVARANVWLAVVVMASVVGHRQYWRHYGLKHGTAWAGSTAPARRYHYYQDMLVTPGAEKEVRVFGLADWTIERQSEPWREAVQFVWSVFDSLLKEFRWAWLLLAVCYFPPFTVLTYQAATGDISVGVFVAAMGAAVAALNQAERSEDDAAVGRLKTAYPTLCALEASGNASAPAPLVPIPDQALPAPEIRLDNLRFGYPGSVAPVLDGFNLTIRSGQSLAIVGVNGAGKTSLIKLLAGMYQPSAGRILVDGQDLADVPVELWRRRLAVIFQDFARYALSVSDNVGFGAPDHIADTEAMARAARRAGVLELIESLPQGWETLLTRQFTGGVDLSGGQWQRIALARALFAVEAGGAQALVLDEPTAQLDVRAEADLFNRFFELTSGLTTIVVSHRFSTVRRADRIVVVDQGKVTEDGSHAALLALGGTYAQMFGLQAARFDQPADDSVDGDECLGEDVPA